MKTDTPFGLCRLSKRKWGVHKFGGASLSDAKLYKICGDLLLSESKGSVEIDLVDILRLSLCLSTTTLPILWRTALMHLLELDSR